MSFASQVVTSFATPERAISVASLMLAAVTTVGSLELLLRRRQLWHRYGLMDWEYTHQSAVQRLAPFLRGVVGNLARPSLIDFFLGLRLTAAILLSVAVLANFSTLLPLAVLAGVQLVVNWRLTYILDGSDKVVTLLTITLFLAALCPRDPMVQCAALHFLSAQITLGYTYAGLIKGAQRAWWTGANLSSVLGTVCFGHPVIHRWNLSRPWLTVIASALTISIESTFLLALVGPPAVTLFYLCVLGLFHASVAAIMGLNTFLPAFVATYPAICFSSVAIRSWLYT